MIFWLVVINALLFPIAGVMVWAGWRGRRRLWFRCALLCVGAVLLSLWIDIINHYWVSAGIQVASLGFYQYMLRAILRIQNGLDTLIMETKVDEALRDLEP